MSENCDFPILGGGMAGVSCGYELAKFGRTVVLEREAHPGTQTTGNSAALYVASYGNAVVRVINLASRAFFDNPPPGFTATPLLSPRPSIYAANRETAPLLAGIAQGADQGGCDTIGQDEMLAMVPILRPEAAVAGLYEAETHRRRCDVAGLCAGTEGIRQRACGECGSDRHRPSGRPLACRNARGCVHRAGADQLTSGRMGRRSSEAACAPDRPCAQAAFRGCCQTRRPFPDP